MKKKLKYFFILKLLFIIIFVCETFGQNKILTLQQQLLQSSWEKKEEFFVGISEDSLKKLANQFSHQLCKIDVTNNLALKLINKNMKEAEKILTYNHKKSLEYDYKFGQYLTLRLQSWVFQRKNQFQEAKKELLKSLEMSKTMKYKHGSALCYRYLGELAEKQSFLKEAAKNYHLAKDIHEELNNLKGVATDYWRLALFYEKQENFNLALNFYEKSLKFAKKINQIEWVTRNYNRIALLKHKKLSFTEAISYAQKVIDIYEKQPLKILNPDYSIALHTLGKIYASKTKDEQDSIHIQKAKHFFYKSIEFQKAKFKSVVPETLLELGVFFEKINQFEKARKEFKQALLQIKYSENELLLSLVLNNLAKSFLKRNNLDSAYFYAKKSYDYGEKNKNFEIEAQSSLILAAIFEKRGDWQNAFLYQKEYQMTSDTLKKRKEIEDNHKIYEQQQWQEEQLKNSYQKKEIELQKENDLKYQKTIKNLFIAGFSLALLGILIVFLFYQKQKNINLLLFKTKEETESQKNELSKRKDVLEKAYKKLEVSNAKNEMFLSEIQKQKNEIDQINKNLENKILERTHILSKALAETARLNKDLDAFLYHSSHDLRRPVTTLLGLYELSKMLNEDKKVSELFEMMRQTASNMDKMLSKLIMVHEINNIDFDKIKTEKINFGEIIHYFQKIYAIQTNEKQIDWKVKVEDKLLFLSDKSLFEAILQNLVENAIIFSQGQKSFVKIDIYKNNNYLIISVEDNGQGIERDLQNHIFEMYFRGTEHSQGNGLGLYVVHRAVEKLKGSIEFESVPLEGSRFKVFLPF